MIVSFLPLAILGLISLGFLRAVQKDQPDISTAVIARQVVLYGLLFVTMVTAAQGASWVYHEIVSSTRNLDNAGLARALALIALGLPAFASLLYLADRRLTADPTERDSPIWTAYLNVALMTALLSVLVGIYRLTRDAIDALAPIDVSDVLFAIIWFIFWGLHWFVLRLRHGIRGDLHLALPSVSSIGLLIFGHVGMLYLIGHDVYNNLTNSAFVRPGPSNAEWSAAFAVGLASWLFFWLRSYEPHRRTLAWYATVVPVGTLIGFVGILASTARLGYLGLVWLLGDREGNTATNHFDELPLLAAILGTGVVAWGYHRWILPSDSTRNEANRSYDYILGAAALVAIVIGAVLTTHGLVSENAVEANTVIAGVTFLTVGGLTWSRFASVVAREYALDPRAELNSTVRRVYLFTTLGVGAIALLVAGVSSLSGVFEDMLNGRLGILSLREESVGLSIVLIVGLVVGAHAYLLRRDQVSASELRPEPRPPTAAPSWPRRVIMLGSDEASVGLLGHPNSTLEFWHRVDTADRPVFDRRALEHELEQCPGEDVLVIMDDDGPTLIPFVR